MKQAIQFLKPVLACFLFLISHQSHALGECIAKQLPDNTDLPDSIRIYQAQPIEVSADKPNEDVQATTPVQSLDQQDIQNLSVVNVADAVKHLPGVMLKDYGGIGGLKTVSVRSLGAEHTAVFINGIKYTDAQTGQVDLGRFGTDNLQRIELLSTGLGDARCLPAIAYASTSSLNLVTDDKMKNRQDEQPFHLRSSLVGGSFGYSALRLGGDTRISNAVFAGLNAEHTQADGEYDYTFQNGQLEEKHTRQNTDIEFTRLESDLGVKFPEGSDLQLKLYGYSSERGLPGAVIIGNKALSRERLWNDEFLAQGTFSTHLFDRLETKVRAKYAYNYVRYTDPNYLNSTGGLDDRFTQHEGYASLSFSYPVNDILSASVASDLQINTLDASQFEDTPERLSWLSALAIKTTINRFRAEASLLASLTNEKSYDEKRIGQKTDFLPAIAAGYWLTESVHLRASFKKSFRLPTFNEMYYPRFGNTNVRPEYTDQFNAGIGLDEGGIFFLKRISLGADVFKIFTKDKIVAVPRGNLFNWSVQNIGRVETTGIELHGELETEKLGRVSLLFSGNYTYQKALDKTPSSSPYWQEATAGNQIAYTPVQTTSFVTSLLINAVTLSWQVSFVGHRYTTGETIMENYLPSYTLHDLGARWETDLFGLTTTVKADINNLFDKNYQVVKSFPMPGRSFRIGLTLNY